MAYQLSDLSTSEQEELRTAVTSAATTLSVNPATPLTATEYNDLAEESLKNASIILGKTLQVDYVYLMMAEGGFTKAKGGTSSILPLAIAAGALIFLSRS